MSEKINDSLISHIGAIKEICSGNEDCNNCDLNVSTDKNLTICLFSVVLPCDWSVDFIENIINEAYNCDGCAELDRLPNGRHCMLGSNHCTRRAVDMYKAKNDIKK